jgi:hypothetical protein
VKKKSTAEPRHARATPLLEPAASVPAASVQTGDNALAPFAGLTALALRFAAGLTPTRTQIVRLRSSRRN